MDIWCIGDINYFVSVLNGLAMLSNIGLFQDVFRVGVIIAVLVMGFQKIFQAGQAGGIPWGRFIVAFIAFKFLFGNVTTVHVNDTYTLQSRDVDNVPYGVAVAGSFLSKVAHEITENLEQAFSLPHMTENGFAGTLQTLTKGRKFITGLDTLHNGRITKTLVEYCDKCTSTGINKGQLDLNAIKVAPDPWNAMKWDSDIYYAMTWLPSDPPAGTLRSCTEAWGAIDNYLRGQLWSDWNKFLSSQICNEGAGTCDPVMTMQSALDSLTNEPQDARNYMLAAVLLPAFEEAQIQFNSFMGKPEMAVVVGQAREQRNIQWAAEGSLFMNIARPMMAFFEGFLYAVAPFMALLVACVPAGLSLLGKYFMMFVWVQLWMPIMAVLNHYAQMVAQQKLSVFIDGDIPLTSIQGHLMGTSALNDWTATAGILVASTPAISLALLFGGAITMTHLAGRLQHGDFINEKSVRPDALQTTPMMTVPTYAKAPDLTEASGYKTGAEGMLGQIDMSEAARAKQASSYQEVQTSGVAFGESVRQTLMSGRSGSIGATGGITTHDGTTAGWTSGTGMSGIFSEGVSHGTTLSTAQKQELAGMLSAGGSLSTSGGFTVFGNGIRLNATGEAALKEHYGAENAAQLAKNINSALGHSSQNNLQAAMQESLAYDAAHGTMANYLEKYDQGKVQDLQNAGKRLYDAKQAYQKDSEIAQSIGSNTKMGKLQFAKIMMHRHGSGEGEAQRLQFHKGIDVLGKGEYQKHLQWAQVQPGINKEAAQWIALDKSLGQLARGGDTAALKARNEHYAEAFSSTTAGMGDSQQYKGITSAGMGARSDRIEQKATGLEPLSEREVEGGIAGAKTQAGHPMSRDEVRQKGMEFSGNISHKAEKEQKQALLEDQKQALSEIKHQFQEHPNLAQKMTEAALGTLRSISTGSMLAGEASKDVAFHPIDAARRLANALTQQGDPSMAIGEAKGAWTKAAAAVYNTAKAETQEDLPEPLRDLYAGTRLNIVGSLVNEKFGWNIAAANKTVPLERRALGEMRKFYQDRGATSEDAAWLAKSAVEVTKQSARTGIDGTGPITQFKQKVDHLEQHAQESRHQLLMGGPGAETRGLQRLDSNKLLYNAAHPDYSGFIMDAAKEFGVDPNLIRGVIQQESRFNQGAISPKGAIGLMQLMPKTAEKLGVDPYNARDNIRGGTQYLKQLLKQYHGDEQMALAAYNAGPGNLPNWNEIKETRHFVPQVLSYKEQFASVDLGKQAQDIQANNPDLASMGKVDYDELKKRAGVKD